MLGAPVVEHPWKTAAFLISMLTRWGNSCRDKFHCHRYSYTVFAIQIDRLCAAEVREILRTSAFRNEIYADHGLFHVAQIMTTTSRSAGFCAAI